MCEYVCVVWGVCVNEMESECSVCMTCLQFSIEFFLPLKDKSENAKKRTNEAKEKNETRRKSN